jgi:hypothetical protein
MSRAAPPGKERPSTRPSNRGHKSKKLRRHYLRHRFVASIYSRLLAERYAQGLLEPFRCYRCGISALDPLGFDGPHRPLCDICSDREGGL